MAKAPGCSSCGERRAWWATVAESGRRMLVDPDPTDDGNVVKLTEEELRAELPELLPGMATEPYVRVLTAGVVRSLQEDADVLPGLLLDSDVHSPYRDRPRYRSHFASCPQARKHRRRS